MKVVKTMSSVILLVGVFCVASLYDFPSVMGVSYSDSQRGGCYCTHVQSKTYFQSADCPESEGCSNTYINHVDSYASEGDTLDITIEDVDADCTGNAYCESKTEFDSDNNCIEIAY